VRRGAREVRIFSWGEKQQDDMRNQLKNARIGSTWMIAAS
jgi:hypothetical protein